MKLTLQTVTPVHIGNGRDYGPYETYMGRSNGKLALVRADINKIYSGLSNEKKDELLIQMEDPNFKLQNFLSKLSSEEKKILATSRIYFSLLKGQKIPDEIHENIKTNNRAYIPGSSIKGSIRTAILYDITDNGDIYKINDLFRFNRRNNREEIDHRKYQDFHDGLFAGNGNKSYSSLMKFLQITDTQTVSKMSICTVASVKASQRGWEWYKRSQYPVLTSLEVINSNKKLEADLNINYREEILQKLGLYNKKEYLTPEKIKECIYNFSRDMIKYELDFAYKYDVKFLENFYNDLETENTPESPLLRIGQGSGFLSTTLALKLKEKSPETFKRVRESLRTKNYSFEFPKTRKVVVEDEVPLGWVKVGF